MSKLVMSAITEELAVCTIQTGITLPSGKTIGAQADIDVFAEFTLESESLGRWVTVTDAKGNTRKLKMSGDLWQVNQKRGVKQKFEKTSAKLTKSAERNFDGARAARVAKLAAMAEECESRGVSIFGEESDSEEIVGRDNPYVNPLCNCARGCINRIFATSFGFSHKEFLIC